MQQLSTRVFVFHNTHAIHSLGSSQSCYLAKSKNVFEKEEKVMSLFFVKAKTKEREERIYLAVKWQQILLWATKGSFLNQYEWLQEIEEHECKPDTSEKQSDFAGIFTDLDRILRERCFFYCVIWNYFL